MTFNEFYRITKEELNYIIRDLGSLKSKAELLDSRLQQWDLLKENVRISGYPERHEDQFSSLKWKGALLLALIVMA
jgi:hypothetical protein